ncbi:ABC transporter ATP-binding protein [Clostridium oryzae]|uniref:Daunorubicin/doxorubicin resistance ATP-binding protein DrrA n=1 Tax=Clostridium oryzae TaxID=1450648 RepID=A0A1V4I6W1_9CLOT|nr:ABC transporter ATP-binding protein [Clostridium oryzae]OPJ55722.1 daunorubicin/doxorubicin resistance ATP-binding protein DrrA [Clostridium oryzae]
MSDIKVENITKRFNDKLVLDNISFHVKQGDVFGLIGPNGAGKSTLINIMTEILKPNKGDISIGGKSILKEPIAAKKYIGLVPQELALMDMLSAYDNLEYFSAFYGLTGKKMREAAREALEVVGLTEKRNEKVKKFSGGMKRRLNLAAAIMHKPEVLIMDEPTVGVDPQSRNCIFEFVKKINKEANTTILYTSHYMEEVESLCNNIFILDMGREVAYGSKHSIKSMAGIHGKVRLRVDSITEEFLVNMKGLTGVKDVFNEDGEISLLINEALFSPEELVLFAAGKDRKIKTLSIEEASLEEVFLSLTGKKLRD